jgi:hypothetical protein
MNIYTKLAEARKIVRDSKIKKAGYNSYSKYDYFTPEQVEALVSEACEATKTICLTNLKQDAIGYYQTLEFVALENPLMSTTAKGIEMIDKISFELRTAAPTMTASNAAQQMGGMDTYSERYLKMKVFQIKDNNLDFDAHDNKPTSASAASRQSAPVSAKPWTKPAPKWERKDNAKESAQLDAGNTLIDLND